MVAQFCALFRFDCAHIFSTSFFRPSTFYLVLLSSSANGSSDYPARWYCLTILDQFLLPFQSSSFLRSVLWEFPCRVPIAVFICHKRLPTISTRRGLSTSITAHSWQGIWKQWPAHSINYETDRCCARPALGAAWGFAKHHQLVTVAGFVKAFQGMLFPCRRCRLQALKCFCVACKTSRSIQRRCWASWYVTHWYSMFDIVVSSLRACKSLVSVSSSGRSDVAAVMWGTAVRKFSNW